MENLLINIEMIIKFASQAEMSKEQTKEHCESVFPTLKYWKNN